MKLIDANSIEYNRKNISGEGIYNIAVQSYIEAMPEVEAIPVEWIEKRIDSYIQFYKEKEKREPALALSISHSINAISELLDDWREENEI